MHRIKGSAELSLTGIALAISRSENRAFSLFKVVSIVIDKFMNYSG